MIMKTERKFTWCVRYYDVRTGVVCYREFKALSVREIKEEVADFAESNEYYIVRILSSIEVFNIVPRVDRALKRGLTFNYVTNNLKFTIMKLLMTVQPKNGEKPSDPMLVDTNKIDLSYLADAFLRAGDKVLIFQSVAEYFVDPFAPCEDCDKKE